MKNKILAVTFLSAVILATGIASGQTASQGPDNDKSETKTTTQDVKDYTFAEKAKFTEEMKRQLAAINRDIEKLDAKIANDDAEAREKAKPELHALHVKADRLGKQIDAAKDATESNWDRVKADSRKSYNELKDGVNRAHRWVSDKLAS
jgi:hypothetical protein